MNANAVYNKLQYNKVDNMTTINLLTKLNFSDEEKQVEKYCHIKFYALLLYFILLCNISTGTYGIPARYQKSDIDVFDCSQLSENDAKRFHAVIQKLQCKNLYFKILCHEIALRKRVIKIVIKPQKNKGSFMPSLFCVAFTNSQALGDESAVIEETFHAFQFLYYRGKYFAPDKNKEVYGAVNMEFEAKFFRAAACIHSGSCMMETPSQKGLSDFVLSLLNKNGSFSELYFTKEQISQYFALLKHFHTHWIKRNKTEQIDNHYDDPVNENLLPYAALHILRKNK